MTYYGPMQCSNSVDKIGKMCKERGIHQYKYKQAVRLLPLACVDDLLGFAWCGNASIALNTFINTHIEMKKLRFHTPDITGKTKCKQLHVGKASALCPELRVHENPLKIFDSDTLPWRHYFVRWVKLRKYFEQSGQSKWHNCTNQKYFGQCKSRGPLFQNSHVAKRKYVPEWSTFQFRSLVWFEKF